MSAALLTMIEEKDRELALMRHWLTGIDRYAEDAARWADENYPVLNELNKLRVAVRIAQGWTMDEAVRWGTTSEVPEHFGSAPTTEKHEEA